MVNGCVTDARDVYFAHQLADKRLRQLLAAPDVHVDSAGTGALVGAGIESGSAAPV